MMPVRIVVAAVTMALAGCDLPGKPSEADRPLRPAQVIDFATLYGENCAGCHGANGTLGAARPLRDPVYLASIGADRLLQITANGVPNSLMPGFGTGAGGTLTVRQIEIIVDGMIGHWGGGAPPTGVPAYTSALAGDAERGATVVASACARCHGADGKGGPHGGPIIDPAYLALLSDQALRSTVLFGRPDLGMPDWRGENGRALTEQDVADVVAWLSAHRSAAPS
jgi:mono/diheme cytochrome c family protein